mmetsp:Transcript_7451/g.12626  ORF Transcript_7451/g.12626 Transcript_7451/m.12626 type:complete len:243 (-) Transcript_7451:87-815(-)
MQFFFDLRQLLRRARAGRASVKKHASTEKDEEADGSVVREHGRQQLRCEPAEKHSKHRHHNQRTNSATPYDKPRVRHRKDGRDEESLVAHLSCKNDEEACSKPLEDCLKLVNAHRVIRARDAVKHALDCTDCNGSTICSQVHAVRLGCCAVSALRMAAVFHSASMRIVLDFLAMELYSTVAINILTVLPLAVTIHIMDINFNFTIMIDILSMCMLLLAIAIDVYRCRLRGMFLEKSFHGGAN